MSPSVSMILKNAIKLFQSSSIVFDLHNKELSIWRITCVSKLSVTQHLAYKWEFLQLSYFNFDFNLIWTAKD